MPISRPTVFALSCALFFSSCVSNKVHRAEVSMREQCESREKVLVQELLERRKEAAEMTKQVGDLNRIIGNQEAEVRDLRSELSSRTQQLGESSSKLIAEKSDLEKELANKNMLLAKRESTLQGISAAQKSRQKIIEDLRSTISKTYAGTAGVTVEIADLAVLVTLPDNGFFDATGQAVSPAGNTILAQFAEVLLNRPELDVDVLAYTDNVLPKGAKNLSDTWDWSLARATSVVRMLIRDFNINANQLTPVAKGEFYPITSNETPEGRQKNRRTILKVYPRLPKVPLAE